MSDKAVFDYFCELHEDNDLSLKAYIGVACFLAASHMQMLEFLKKKNEEGLTGKVLLEYWHDCMEQYTEREHRKKFFLQVVRQAKQVNIHHFPRLDIHSLSTATSRNGTWHQGGD